MKAFLFSLCMLGILISIIFTNAAYVDRVTQELHHELSHLPACAQAAEGAHAVLLHWESNARVLEFSVSAADMDALGDLLVSLYTATQLNDEKAFEQARALACSGLMRIRDLERFRFLHIL